MKNKFEFLKDILNKSNNETLIINRGEFLDSSVLSYSCNLEFISSLSSISSGPTKFPTPI